MAGSFHIQWHITNLCNLRCRHCYQEDFSKNCDLDWTGLQRISKNVLTTLQAWNRKASIHLTGGEPLLKPELFLLLDDLNQTPASSRTVRHCSSVAKTRLREMPYSKDNSLVSSLVASISRE